MNMYIWKIGSLNQLFRRGSYTQIIFSKNKVLSGKTEFFVIGPFFDKTFLYRNSTLSIVTLSAKK